MTTSETLIAIAAAALSLALAYIPPLKKRYEPLEKDVKASIMGGLLLVVTLAVYALGCLDLASEFGLGVTCDKGGAVNLVQALFIALAANQTTFTLLVSPFKRSEKPSA